MHRLVLTTKDRHRIAVVHYQPVHQPWTDDGPGRCRVSPYQITRVPRTLRGAPHGHRKVVVLAHGFFNNKDVYLFRKMAQGISQHYDVVAFDFRGHGKSSGLFSWTSREGADLQAVLAYVKEFGYASVGLIGFSLGAAISLIEAAHNPDIKTVIAVSAPYDFWEIDYHFWEPGMWKDLKLNLGYKGKGKGVRPGNPLEPKIAPIRIVDRIAPRSVLFIHGSDDWLIRPRHSQALFRKAKDPKKIEIIEHGGHAEKIFDDYPEEFMNMCLDWFKKNL